jgi:uncharacterized protein YcnI
LKRALAASVAAALAAAAPALAHVSVQPARTEPGEQTLEFVVPNEYFDERMPSQIAEVVIEAPRGVTVGAAQAKPGWTSRRRGRTTTWSGGSIRYGQYELFGLEAELPADDPNVVFDATERFASPRGRAERYPVRLAIGSGTQGSDSHGLAVAALGVAAAAVVLAGAAFFLGLARWLRGG